MKPLLAEQSCGIVFTTIGWILAISAVIVGIVCLVRRAVLFGIVLIVVGVMGPGGLTVVCRSTWRRTRRRGPSYPGS
jgi:hypothetical protein